MRFLPSRHLPFGDKSFPFRDRLTDHVEMAAPVSDGVGPPPALGAPEQDSFGAPYQCQCSASMRIERAPTGASFASRD
jgi:hypothetical protein